MADGVHRGGEHWFTRPSEVRCGTDSVASPAGLIGTRAMFPPELADPATRRGTRGVISRRVVTPSVTRGSTALMRPGSRPLVSVVVPCYCGERHLATAVESVLAQTLTDFELVVIDDDSPDHTAALMVDYQDPRVRFLRNPTRLGAEGNWNRCLLEATGTYVKLLPQDDVLAPDCLERQVAVLRNDSAQRLALVCSARRIVDDRGAQIAIRRPLGSRGAVFPARTLMRRCIRHGTNLIGEPGGVLFRRALANEIGVFNGRFPYVLDLEYWARLLTRGDAHYLPAPLAAFRVSAGSWSVAIGRGQGRDFGRFIRTLHGHPVYRASRPEIFFGRQVAHLNNLLRWLLYRIVVKRS
jgi:glycosyltransferase involved in cell wall biosynthesis